MTGRVEGKVALITGGGAGMGRATAKLLASEGAKVVIAEWNEEAAKRVRREIEADGGSAKEIVLDISSPENSKQMIDFAVAEFGGLDILNNQVFAIEAGLVEDLSYEGWELTLRLTLTSTFLGCKHALPVMKERGGGSIINTASIAGFTVDPGLSAYGTAKAGVIAFTKYVAAEYGRHNIRCNAVSPGTVQSDAFLQTFGESSTMTLLRAAPSPSLRQRTPEELQELRRQMAEATAFGKVGLPEEIARIVLFLASDESSLITGANIVADAAVSTRVRLPSMIGFEG